MKNGWIGALVVVGAAAAIIAYKQTRPTAKDEGTSAPTAFAPQASTGFPGRDAMTTAAAAAPSVILFADPNEAESSCGCGQIIRLVRGATARGVSVREVSPSSSSLLASRYHVTVAPTVLVLDSAGQILSRREGEDAETISAIQSDLDRLATVTP